ncbi:MAG: DNA translocase FtsK 4TM domain-containing protein, partial [Bacteroidia bacterium]|nr:DNA translocase FtsK 4TM domain-containing protein [Bacteroidia bacterium]
MTYSLDTLNSRNTPASGAPGGIKRFAHEVSLILGLLGLVFWLAALLSYSPQDAAWSTSGTAEAAGAVQAATRNWGGRVGAWLADASYFLLGFSVWWALAAGVQV